MTNDYRAHIPETVTDMGHIEGTCSTCGKIIYSATTATTCHRAGNWMQSINPNYFSWADHPLEGPEE